VKRKQSELSGGAIPGELSLIEAIRSRASARSGGGRGVRLGIGDDCAVLRPSPGHEMVVTTDFSLEGRHFRRDWHPPQSVGHRCLARGLSDLAAMGAKPLAVFLSLALPARLPVRWVDGFLEGLLALAERHHVPLAGGDTAESPALIAMDIVAVGEVKRGHALLRSGAREGDAIYVTGALGGAAAELLMLERSLRRFRKTPAAETGHPHLYPQPRLEVGWRLARGMAHAAIDLSDGLSTDLSHLCRASGVSAEIEEELIPLHSFSIAIQKNGVRSSPLDLALKGGEDYELLFTAGSNVRIPRGVGGVPIHRIGRIVPRKRSGPPIRMQSLSGKWIEVRPGGWEHFGTRSRSR